jgi:hypothetical protein
MKTTVKIAIWMIAVVLFTGCNKGNLVIYPAPESEKHSDDYTLKVNGKDVFCYEARVYDTRYTEGMLYGEKGLAYSTVSFAYFDISGPVKVKITVNDDTESAVIRPLSHNIVPVVRNNTIEFTIREPGSYTIEPNGSDKRVLHLFANPLQEKPDPEDPDIIYFGPGEHVVSTINLKDNQTLFVDGGAVVYFDIDEDETPYRTEVRSGVINLLRYDHAIQAVNTRNVKIKGRGIIDFERVGAKYGRKNPIHIGHSNNVKIEGVILRDATCWHLTVYRSDNVVVDNLKAISMNYNTDGICVVLSQNVHIKNCFFRQRDDGIIMKAMDTGNTDAFIEEIRYPPVSTSDVLVENCVIWSDWGYALGATYEIRKPVHDIIFRNCDIIHATHAVDLQGVLGILVSDSSTVSNVRFENITIERSLKPLIKMDMRATPWTVNHELGNIRDIHFKNIRYLSGDIQPVIFLGESETGNIKNIHLTGLEFLGKHIESVFDWDFVFNEHVHNINIKK